MISPNPLGISPVIFSLGPIEVRYYGLMYVIGFIIANWFMGKLSENGFLKLTKESIDRYITSLIIGMFLGARFFYVFIYNWDHYSQNLGKIFAVWEGGLSFHGAVVGMCFATYYTAKKNKLSFFEIADSLVLVAPPGLLFGRIGNFINGELYGRITDSPLGMIFPTGGPYPRHPSQLYESFLEGLILFLILFWVHKKQKVYGITSAAFFLFYGAFRYIVEFFREADVQLGYYFGGTTTMGQILCAIMVVVSFFIYRYAKKANVPSPLAN